METVRKTYKEKLRPTPEQERALEVVLSALSHALQRGPGAARRSLLGSDATSR